MRTAQSWPLTWQLSAVLLTVTPLVAAAAEPPDSSSTAATVTPPAAKPTPTTAKPTTAGPTATKPATSGPTPGAKPATASPANAAKPATSTSPGAAKPAGSPPTAAAKPATPGQANPGLQKGPVPGAPPPVGASSPPSVDPAKADLPLAQATFGIKGFGALFATIEVAVPGKPAVQALHCELFADKTPLTVANFVGLARGLRPWKDPKLGQWVKKPLYDGNQLHRVVPELLIQGGDPNCTVAPDCRNSAGLGEPGYTIPDELKPELRFDRPGRLAMANRGPNTSGAQFFITERDAAWLNGSHTIFGQCDSPELVTELARVEAGSRDQPKVPLVIKRVTFIRKAK